MKTSGIRQFGAWLFTAWLMMTPWAPAQEANRNNQPDAQAISQTGLLPIYGVDLNFDAACGNGIRSPRGSAGSSQCDSLAVTQRLWQSLKSGGFNVIRFPVNVRDAQAAAARVASLCAWARDNNVKFIPVLMGAERSQPLSADYAASVPAFIGALLAALRSGDGQALESYSQILAFQLENALNDERLHGAMPIEVAQARLVLAASKLRKAEQAGLSNTGLNPTPLMVNASFDYELDKARSGSGAVLSDEAYRRGYETLKRFLTELAASPDINLIGVDWFAGSLSAGSPEKFPALLESLAADFADRQFVITTGCSADSRSPAEQRKFYTQAFASLADYRVRSGADSPFLGALFHEALAGKSEHNFGLLSSRSSLQSGAVITAQPGLESLREIANRINEASAAIAAETESSASEPAAEKADPLPLSVKPASSTLNFRNALMDRAQQLLIAALDHALDRLLNRGGSSASSDSGNGDKTGSENSSNTDEASSGGSKAGSDNPAGNPPAVEDTSGSKEPGSNTSGGNNNGTTVIKGPVLGKANKPLVKMESLVRNPSTGSSGAVNPSSGTKPQAEGSKIAPVPVRPIVPMRLVVPVTAGLVSKPAAVSSVGTSGSNVRPVQISPVGSKPPVQISVSGGNKKPAQVAPVTGIRIGGNSSLYGTTSGNTNHRSNASGSDVRPHGNSSFGNRRDHRNSGISRPTGPTILRVPNQDPRRAKTPSGPVRRR